MPLAKGDKSKYVLQALGYIADHYGDQDISITTIAQHLGVSKNHRHRSWYSEGDMPTCFLKVLPK